MNNEELRQNLEKRVERQFTPSIITGLQVCPQHCYCGDLIVNNKPHKTCCMCGHRKLNEQCLKSTAGIT